MRRIHGWNSGRWARRNPSSPPWECPTMSKRSLGMVRAKLAIWFSE